MAFDPDTFLAQPTLAAGNVQPQANPSNFDPDAFLAQSGPQQPASGGIPGSSFTAGAEGLAEGVLGPVAPFVEREIYGRKPEDIRATQEAHPVVKGVANAVGFVGSALAGTGEAALLGKAGEGALALSKLGGEGAGIASKLAAGATKLSTEMALYQAGDEMTKNIVQDPQWSAESAITNIGLSAALGALTGGALKGTGMLGTAGLEKLGVSGGGLKTLSDRLVARAGGLDPLENVYNEAKNAHEAYQAMGDSLNGPEGIKAEAIKNSMPEVTERNTAKINEHLNEINDKLSNIIGNSETDPYLKNATPKFQFHQNQFLETVTNPEASYEDKFKALDTLKRDMQGLAKYGGTAEETKVSQVAKQAAAEIRQGLEDNKVWGDAGKLQQNINSAWKNAIPGVEDFQRKFMQKGANGVNEIDPTKIRTYMNEAGRSQSQTIRQQMMGKFVSSMEDMQKAVDNAYNKAGVENPHQPISLGNLKESLGKPDKWTQAADKIYDQHLSNAGASALGGAAGALAGHATGIPFAAYGLGYLGEKISSKLMPSIMDALIKNPINMEGFAKANSFVKDVVAGDKQLTDVTGAIFSSGKTLPSHLMPSGKDIDMLDKRLQSVDNNPQKLFEGAQQDKTAHYMPQHAETNSKTIANASEYLNSQRPKPVRASPLDTELPPTKAQQLQFRRTLAVAQQPLIVIPDIKDGSIQVSDVMTLKTLYPAVYAKIGNQLMNQMSQSMSEGKVVPYKTRIGMSIFLGQPMDSTMQPDSIMAAQAAQAPKGGPQQTGAPSNKKGGGVKHSTSTLGKMNNEYLTPNQASELNKNKKD